MGRLRLGVSWCSRVAADLSSVLVRPDDIEPVLAEAADIIAQLNLLRVLGDNRVYQILKLIVQLIQIRSVLLFSLLSLARDLILNVLDGLRTITDEISKFSIKLALDRIDFLVVQT